MGKVVHTDNYDLTSELLGLNMVNTINEQIQNQIIKPNGKMTAIHILNDTLLYLKHHSVYKTFLRLSNEIHDHGYYEPYDLIINKLHHYEIADDLIGDLMDDEQYQDSDIGVDEDDEAQYNHVEDWLGKKENYHKIYPYLQDDELNPKSYHALDKSDMTNLVKSLIKDVSTFHFSEKHMKQMPDLIKQDDEFKKANEKHD